MTEYSDRRRATAVATFATKKLLAWLKLRPQGRSLGLSTNDAVEPSTDAPAAAAEKPLVCRSPAEVLGLAELSAGGSAVAATESSCNTPARFSSQQQSCANSRRISRVWQSLVKDSSAQPTRYFQRRSEQPSLPPRARSASAVDTPAAARAAGRPTAALAAIRQFCSSVPPATALEPVPPSPCSGAACAVSSLGSDAGSRLLHLLSRGDDKPQEHSSPPDTCGPSPLIHPPRPDCIQSPARAASPLAPPPCVNEVVKPAAAGLSASDRELTAGVPAARGPTPALSAVTTATRTACGPPSWAAAEPVNALALAAQGDAAAAAAPLPTAVDVLGTNNQSHPCNIGLVQLRPCGLVTLLHGEGFVDASSATAGGAGGRADRCGPLLELLSGSMGFDLCDELDVGGDVDLVVLPRAAGGCGRGAAAACINVRKWACLVNGIAEGAAAAAVARVGATGDGAAADGAPCGATALSDAWRDLPQEHHHVPPPGHQRGPQEAGPGSAGQVELSGENLSDLFGTLGRICDELAAQALAAAAGAGDGRVAVAGGGAGDRTRPAPHGCGVAGGGTHGRSGTAACEMLLTFGDLGRDGEEVGSGGVRTGCN